MSRRRFNKSLCVSSWPPSDWDPPKSGPKKRGPRGTEVLYDKPFNSWLREKADKYNLSPKTIAIRCHVDVQTSYSWLYYGQLPTTRTLFRVVDVLSLSSGEDAGVLWQELHDLWRVTNLKKKTDPQ